MSDAVIGLIVNPRSGSDVRRVIAAAASSTFEDKISIIRRVVAGAELQGISRFVALHDPHRLVVRATDTNRRVQVDTLDMALTHTETDSETAAAMMRDLGCAVVVVLGGDGTNRVVARGWPDVPVVPLSTGTNNAFPYYVEPTVAGTAIGLVAADEIPVDEVSRPAKVIRLDHEGDDDLALIDAVAVDDPYVGSLELFDPATMRAALLTRADPASIGFSSVGGLLDPLAEAEDHGLFVRFASIEAADRIVRAPTAPGHYSDIGIAECRRVALDEPVEVPGPVLLAFDGERKRRVHEGETVSMRVRRDGPRVIDVHQVMTRAAREGRFVRSPG